MAANLGSTSEEGEMDVDGLVLLNKSQATVLLVRNQDEGKRRGCVHKRTDSPRQTDEKVYKCKVDDGKVTWHPYGLSSPQGTSKGNILCLAIDPNRYMERILND